MAVIVMDVGDHDGLHARTVLDWLGVHPRVENQKLTILFELEAGVAKLCDLHNFILPRFVAARA
jgi:hypothetical protein